MRACVPGWGFTFSDMESYSSRYNAESIQETVMVYGRVAVGATASYSLYKKESPADL